jgi:hypothetical protein
MQGRRFHGAALRKRAQAAAVTARHPQKQHQTGGGQEDEQDSAGASNRGPGADGHASGGDAHGHRRPEDDLQRIKPAMAARRGI